MQCARFIWLSRKRKWNKATTGNKLWFTRTPLESKGRKWNCQITVATRRIKVQLYHFPSSILWRLVIRKRIYLPRISKNRRHAFTIALFWRIEATRQRKSEPRLSRRDILLFPKRQRPRARTHTKPAKLRIAKLSSCHSSVDGPLYGTGGGTPAPHFSTLSQAIASRCGVLRNSRIAIYLTNG